MRFNLPSISFVPKITHTLFKDSREDQFHFRCKILLDHTEATPFLGQLVHSLINSRAHNLGNASAELCVLEEGDLLHVLGAAPVPAPRLLQHPRRHHHHLKGESQDQVSGRWTTFD